MHPQLLKITQRIIERSRESREGYLDLLKQTQDLSPAASCLSCSNMAHVVAASPATDKQTIAQHISSNIGIVTAYNDMLSAHQPLADCLLYTSDAADES